MVTRNGYIIVSNKFIIHCSPNPRAWGSVLCLPVNVHIIVVFGISVLKNRIHNRDRGGENIGWLAHLDPIIGHNPRSGVPQIRKATAPILFDQLKDGVFWNVNVRNSNVK
jgi:hypothetical protein